jgi:hypothetical protein
VEQPSDRNDAFYATVPVFDGFDRVIDAALYQPLPDDWLVGLADVVDSTGAIAAGGYKLVNMAGASVITAVANASGTHDFPFVFGGDGASFAVPSTWAAHARTALSETIVFAREEMNLALRGAFVPITAIRAQGLDVRVARFAPSPNVTYAMFAGGGLAWAEREMKRGAFAVSPAPAGARPDLTGLSCRFEKIPAARGTILSLIVRPAESATKPGFQSLLEALLALTANDRDAGRPVSQAALRIRWPPAGLAFEASARSRHGRRRLPDWIAVAARTLLYMVILRLDIPVGRFSKRVYYSEVVENSDFRKYDDALRMTLDCTPELAERIEALLADAAARDVARYGLHRQADALVTCFTPTVFGKHFHFIDGAAGGYAMAAQNMRR